MTEPLVDDLPRPELCEDCYAQRHRAYCKTFPITCRDQQELWDSGYAAAVKRAEAAEAKLARVAGVFKAWKDGDEPEGQPSARRTLLQIGAILEEP